MTDTTEKKRLFLPRGEVVHDPRADAMVRAPLPHHQSLCVRIVDKRVMDVIHVDYFDSSTVEDDVFSSHTEAYVRLRALPEDLQKQIHAIIEARGLEERATWELAELQDVLEALPKEEVPRPVLHHGEPGIDPSSGWSSNEMPMLASLPKVD